ncbi:MAG: SURF1 family protein [Proteobacteria bacterium]|nr:MAG: SURF1 family protein [Pseudomonadota bacterium]
MENGLNRSMYSSRAIRVFAPLISTRFVATFAALFGLVAGLTLLVSLGFWQLERGAEKAAIRAEYESRTAMPPIRMRAERIDPELFEFYRVEVEGVYRPEYQVLVDNRIRNGRPGYGVITPLRLSGSDMHVLVDRGWIPWNADRTVLPDVPTPEGMQHVSGVLKRPPTDYYTLEKSKPGVADAVWQNLDLDHYRNVKSIKLQDLVVLLSPESGAGGFARNLPEYTDDWVARHRGYAVQWFGLAGVLLIVFLVLAMRRDRTRRDERQ